MEYRNDKEKNGECNGAWKAGNVFPKVGIALEWFQSWHYALDAVTVGSEERWYVE
jgi:hypothetical protein